jgi:hypothetical protein
MKSIVFIFILFSYAFNNAQTVTPKDSKDSEFKLKNYKSNPNDRLILEINHTGFLGLPNGIKQSYVKSIGFNFAFMFDKPIGKSSFSFGYGIGLLSHNFHSNAEYVYSRDSINNSFLTKLEPINRPYTLNRFAQKILEIPLEMRYRTKTDRQFKIHFGVKLGYVVNDFRSIKDNDGKIRIYNTKNVNYLRYGVNFRIGYEQITLTACCYISEVFNQNKGANGITPYTVGIAIIPY